MRGRPSWAVATIMAFLTTVGSVFATIHYSETGTVFTVAARQQDVIKNIEGIKDDIANLRRDIGVVRDQTQKNAGALDTLTISMIKHQNP